MKYFILNVLIFMQLGLVYANVDVPATVKTVPQVVVVKFKDLPEMGNLEAETGIPAVDKILRENNVYQLARIVPPDPALKTDRFSKIYYAYFSGTISPVVIARRLKLNDYIEYAEPKYKHKICEIPNDPMYSQQYYTSVIHAADAWSKVRGEQGSVVVAIVDGGTDILHPDLSDNVWVNKNEIPGNKIDDDLNGKIDDINGWNFANNTNNPVGLVNTPINADHGTHTAGLACAVTNNSLGVAGVSWNAKVMAINVSDPREDFYILSGYEGIIYAAQIGASVINCSWGEYAASEFGREAINYAIEMGAAVVAAAGNDNLNAPHYPASFQNVLSVAATSSSDQKSSFSNYGPDIDVAAPGDYILSLINNGGYGSKSGTSMASPIAAGVVALIRTLNPGWNGVQAVEQLRVTADNVDDVNPSYVGKLGRGRINAARAVTETSPSIRITEVQYSDEDKDDIIEPGETVDVFVNLKNYLQSTKSIQLTLSTEDNYVFLLNKSSLIASLTTHEENTHETPFRFRSKDFTPSGHPVDFQLEIKSGDYVEVEHFRMIIMPIFGNIDINNIALSVTNVGRIGFADLANSSQGIGLLYDGGPNLLFEGSLLMGTGPEKILNASRGVLSDNVLQFDMDFEVDEEGDIRILTPGTISDQESMGIFTDTAADNPLNIRITQFTFAKSSPPYDDLILFKYYVENLNATPITNFHFGMFFDWDIDGANFSTNMVDFDASRKLAYAYDAGNGPDTYVGCSILSDGRINYRAIYNDETHENNPGWGLYDGFTDLEKWEAISGGEVYTKAGPSDVSQVIATGPHTIDGKGNLEFGMAMLAGTDSKDLQTNAEAAQTLWQELESMDIRRPQKLYVPQNWLIKTNYPNPFNSSTVFEYELGAPSQVELTIYDTLGRKIRTLVQSRQNSGRYSVKWNGTDRMERIVSSGTYFYRFLASEYSKTGKILYLR
ncbi:S8 family serine peptidase [candidate division KSB1 bacterium]|nr:S8 family serine peptidase [candidate division KSB1 bacterium]